MGTKNTIFTLNANEVQSAVTSRATVTGTTVYGDPISAIEEITQSAYVPPVNPYIYIENETTHEDSAEVHILSQSTGFYFDIEEVGIVSGTLGTGSTPGHTSEHNYIDTAGIYGTRLGVFIDGRNCTAIGTGYAVNYIDVTGRTSGGQTVRATLELTITLQKARMKFIYSTSGAPTEPLNTTYALRVDGTTILSTDGTVTIDYVHSSAYTISVLANVSWTLSYPQQISDINIIADSSTIDPNYLVDTLILPGNYGQFSSNGVTTTFLGGTVNVTGSNKVTFNGSVQGSEDAAMSIAADTAFDGNVSDMNIYL